MPAAAKGGPLAGAEGAQRVVAVLRQVVHPSVPLVPLCAHRATPAQQPHALLPRVLVVLWLAPVVLGGVPPPCNAGVVGQRQLPRLPLARFCEACGAFRLSGAGIIWEGWGRGSFNDCSNQPLCYVQRTDRGVLQATSSHMLSAQHSDLKRTVAGIPSPFF